MPFIKGASVVECLEQARDAIRGQLREREADFRSWGPAWPWNLAVQVHKYVFDLPADRLRQVRLHADAINGTMSVVHYALDAIGNGDEYARSSGYAFLGHGVPSELWAREYPVPDMPELQMGYRYRDVILNSTTVGRQQNACNIYRLTEDRRTERHVFVEIGGGYGSFALDARRILPNCAYVIADLPETLIFSASYLITHRPDLRFYVYAPGDDLSEALRDTDAFDFAFIPNYRAELLANLDRIDIGFNSISFPEMSLAAMKQYLEMITPRLRGFFMSVNLRYSFDRSIQRPGTDETLSDYFKLFPQPKDYRRQLNLSQERFDDPSFRAVYVGTTENCRPLRNAELRTVFESTGPVTLRRGFLGKSVIRNGESEAAQMAAAD